MVYVLQQGGSFTDAVINLCKILLEQLLQNTAHPIEREVSYLPLNIASDDVDA